MNLSGVIYESVVDGDGVRNTIFISGCKHECEHCHNKQTWDFNHGSPFTKDKQLQFINKCKQNPLLQGITISGGDPIYNHSEVVEFLKLYKSEIKHHDIWLYTGFKFEDIKSLDILNYIDVLVDGKFDVTKKDLSLKFRGSSNQRIIDIQKSINSNQVVLY